MLQKLKVGIVTVLAIFGLAAPLFATTAVFAATAPAGSCRILVESVSQVGQTTNPTTVEKCSKLMPSGKDANGVAWSSTKCYGINVHDNQPVIAMTLSCSNPLMSGAKIQYCGNGLTIAPNNDPSQCTTSANANCGTASTPACTDTVVVTDPAANGGSCADVSNCDLINNYINPFVNFLAAAVGLAVVISIVIGGIQYGSSGGDPSKVTQAKNRIRNALVALVTFLFLYALLNFLIPGGLL